MGWKEDLQAYQTPMGGAYRMMREDKNNLSYWFPKLEGNIKGLSLPETAIIQVPDRICDCFWAYDGPFAESFEDDVYGFVKECVMPAMAEKHLTGLVFLKNGTFSDKFDFRYCAASYSVPEITQSLLVINYEAVVCGAGGLTEVVVRERINHYTGGRLRIYHGMPLVPETRVFFDFDTYNVLYSVNYWDAEYCEEAISRDATDKIVYAAAKDGLEIFHQEHKKDIEGMVLDGLSGNVPLTGKWSVDVMYDDAADKYWLIDMALAEQSAYWDPGRL